MVVGFDLERGYILCTIRSLFLTEKKEERVP